MKNNTAIIMWLCLILPVPTLAHDPKELDDLMRTVFTKNEAQYIKMKELQKKMAKEAFNNAETYLCEYHGTGNKDKVVLKYSFRRNPESLKKFTDGLIEKDPKGWTGYPLYGHDTWTTSENYEVITLLYSFYSNQSIQSEELTLKPFHKTYTVTINKNNLTSTWLYFEHLKSENIKLSSTPEYDRNYFLQGDCKIHKNTQIDYKFKSIGYKGYTNISGLNFIK